MCRVRHTLRSPGCAVLVAVLMIAAWRMPSALAQGAADAKDKPATWKLSTAVGPAFVLGKAGERWTKLVAEASNGRLAFQWFPGAALAQRDPAREFLALRDGATDFAVGSSLFWATQVQELTVIGLPWLAPEAKDLDALLGGAVRERLDDAIERAGGVALAYAPLGHRALATVATAVRAPEDLAGLAVRTGAVPLLTDLFVALGAQPQAMAFADAEAAFRAGTLKAQEGTPASFATARLDALGLRHAVLWGAIAEVAIFAANRATWDRLTEEQRVLIRGAAQKVATELPELARAESDAALAELRKRGIAMTRLTPTGHAAFAAATRAVRDRWSTVAGEELARAAGEAVAAARR